jgi:hypothetical protein
MFSLLSAFILSLSVGIGSVFAAVPADVQTELSTAKADVLTIGALVFAIAVAIVLFKWFKRSL